MINAESLEVSSEQAIGGEAELVELGHASCETRGLFFGSVLELSILPLRLI